MFHDIPDCKTKCNDAEHRTAVNSFTAGSIMLMQTNSAGNKCLKGNGPLVPVSWFFMLLKSTSCRHAAWHLLACSDMSARDNEFLSIIEQQADAKTCRAASV